MIKEWILEYNPKNEEETLSALREIMQEVTLAGLSRTDFFVKAAFYGGTALRIFHNLDRFSDKSETIWKELVLEETIKQIGIKSNREIKIKIEIDRKPPQGFNTEEKLLLRPFSFYVKCFDLSSLFA